MNLKELFCEYLESDEYQAAGAITESKWANDLIYNHIQSSYKDSEFRVLEFLITQNAYCAEMQGFINGFRYAAQLINKRLLESSVFYG